MIKSNSHKLNSLACLSVAMLALVGCDNRVSSAEEKMAEIRKSPSQPIEPPPVTEKIKDFVYSASKERSPFVPPNLSVADTQAEEGGIQPDLERRKDELENYPLDKLVYRGLFVSPTGEQNGLIQRPDGTVASVTVGNHMGENYGRIVEITATHINLIEIVPDNRSGFVERAASLVSPTS